MDVHCDKREHLYLNAIYVLIFTGTVLQICFPEMHTIWCSCSLALLLYYIFVRELELKYDTLTRFKNYRFFIAHLEELSKEEGLTMIVMEAMNLNEVNEKYGFFEGDCYLKDAARVIADTFQNSGEIFRLTGGTFCVVVKHTKEANVIHSLQHMRVKARKYKRKAIPLTFESGYEMYYKDNKASNDKRNEAIRHCFYAAQQNLQHEKIEALED